MKTTTHPTLTLPTLHALELRRHRKTITTLTRAGESLLSIASAICAKDSMIRFARLSDSTQVAYLSIFRIHHMAMRAVNPNFK